MNTYAVDIKAIAVLVRVDGTITRLPFKTKLQADKKMLELIGQGYKFDPYLYADWSEPTSNPDYAPTPEHSF